MNYAITAAVVDSGGVTQVLVRGDGAGIHTVQAAHDKAVTEVTYGRAGSEVDKGYMANPPSGVILKEFEVAARTDVDDVFRDMIGAGYRGLQEPHDAFWGARYAMIEDSDGIAVGLMSPVSPDKKSEPPNL